MRPTRYRHQAALRVGEKAVVRQVGVGLQITVVLRQKFLGSSALARRSVVKDNSRTVSYTHLDVYKRQEGDVEDRPH